MQPSELTRKFTRVNLRAPSSPTRNTDGAFGVDLHNQVSVGKMDTKRGSDRFAVENMSTGKDCIDRLCVLEREGGKPPRLPFEVAHDHACIHLSRQCQHLRVTRILPHAAPKESPCQIPKSIFLDRLFRQGGSRTCQ